MLAQGAGGNLSVLLVLNYAGGGARERCAPVALNRTIGTAATAAPTL
jgi:hypothetical protein